MKGKKFETKDLALATFLFSRGYLIVGINEANGDEPAYIFADDSKRSRLAKEFYDGQTRIEPYAFWRHLIILENLEDQFSTANRMSKLYR